MESGYVKVRYRAADAANAATETVDARAGWKSTLPTTTPKPSCPAASRFGLGGKVYVDRLGSLVTDINANTGAGTQAGTHRLPRRAGRC